MTTSTAAWLQAAGLSACLADKLSGVPLEQLKRLMLSDFDRLGVTDYKEKQLLYKTLRSSPSAAPSEPTSLGSTPQLTPQPSTGPR